MKILITGATGLIGSELVPALQSFGHQIHYLTTSPTKKKYFTDAQSFLWNPQKNEIDSRCWEGVSVLIHLAGASISIPWTTANRIKIRQSRIQSTQLLVQSLKATKKTLDTVVAASGIGLYPSSLDGLYKESDAAGSDFLSSVVKDWEDVVNDFASYTSKIIKLRTGLVLSRKGGVLPVLSLPVQMGLGAAFGSGKQGQSWVHISDLIQLYIFALELDESNVFNAVAPQPVTQNELIKILGLVIKRPVFLPNIPAFLIRLFLGDRSALVLGSQFVSAALIQEKGFLFRYTTLEMALRQLYSAEK